MITGTLHKSLTKSEPAQPELAKPLNLVKLKKTFLYVGNSSERTTRCLAFFDYGYVTERFDEAKNRLIELYEDNNIPDFIIVDISLNASEFSSFVLWLHSNKWSFMIPVLYNETALTKAELEQLNELSIADDIVNIEEYCNGLYQKAGLLKSAKSLQSVNDRSESISDLGKTPVGKRIFDIIVAALCLIILSPLFLLIAIVIRLESRGPIIYRSKRAGKGFKVFDFYKFRTMVDNADQQIDSFSELNLYAGNTEKKIKFFKIENDPRVTRVGSFLRNSSLDELPQLINVLKGDMSIVGNRPLPLYEASTLTTNDTSERFIAPAGITGLWQVTKRGRDNMDAEERVGLDISYARQQGFRMDCKILMQTPLALIQKSNV